MKRPVIFVISVLAGASLLFSFSGPQDNRNHELNGPVFQEEVQAFPEDVEAIFQNSCYGCHSSESSNMKAKTKLNFSNWSEMSDAKKAGKIGNITDAVKAGDMPPAKFLEKYPERSLGKEQTDLIEQWSSSELKNLLGE